MFPLTNNKSLSMPLAAIRMQCAIVVVCNSYGDAMMVLGEVKHLLQLATQ